jgi:hypothetical protein
MKVDLTKLTVKSEIRKENDLVQQEVDDDRRHVIQVNILVNSPYLFTYLGGHCPNHEDAQSSQACSVGCRSFEPACVAIYSEGPSHQKVNRHTH